MDFLNKAFAQLSDLFRSMTPGARVTAGLLLAVVVISLGYLFRYEVSAADTYLMNGEPIPPSLMPQMEAAFAKAHLDSYEIVGSKIRVPRGQQGTYMGRWPTPRPCRPGRAISSATRSKAATLLKPRNSGRSEPGMPCRKNFRWLSTT